MTTTKVKPPHSKDGRLQLCSRCNRYCSRYKNMCPTCDKRDERQRKVLDSILPWLPTFKPVQISARHLVGTFGKRGLFIIWTDSQILDRATYREIIAEAKAAGVAGPHMIYGRVASYMGPGIDFVQIQR